ncbi:MAG: DUF4230 domain-containing protein [Novosphingobium sp.]|nr:DUF4230 domain-containing protein [Novosphingobium sp.]
MDNSDLTPEPTAPKANPARAAALPWILFVAMLAVAVWALWRSFAASPDGDPVAATLDAFEKQNRLTVFTAQLSPVVASKDEQLFGLVESRQVAVIPARVDYTLDLSEMDANRLDWNADTQELDVRLPALTLSKPNLDEARAQYLREGVWISRDTQDRMTRANTRLAEKQAAEQAANPVLMGLATSAAKEAIRQNIAIPLKVAGFDDVKVEVRFDGEREPR